MDNKAPHAKAILKNELLMGVLDKLETEAIEDMLSAKPSDDQARKDASFKANTVRNIRRELIQLAAEKDNPMPRRA